MAYISPGAGVSTAQNELQQIDALEGAGSTVQVVKTALDATTISYVPAAGHTVAIYSLSLGTSGTVLVTVNGVNKFTTRGAGAYQAYADGQGALKGVQLVGNNVKSIAISAPAADPFICTMRILIIV